MSLNSPKLSARHQLWLYGVFSVLFISGAGWAAAHFFLSQQTEFGEIPHPSEPWWLNVHGAAAMAMLVLLGTLIPLHVRRGWQMKRNRTSGSLLLAFNAILTITGYALYYAGAEQLRNWSSRVHLILGLAIPILLAAHVFLGLRTRR
jgi:cation transport ATPase